MKEKALKRWVSLVLSFTVQCMVLHAAVAGAKEDDSEQDLETPAYELREVVVRSSRIREAQDDPSSFTTVIVPEQFASQFRTAEDHLSHSPGVNIKRYGGLGQYSTVSIRGSSSEQVLVLLDGIKLNTGEGGSVDFSTIPVESIERIEVIRGGGTTQYGSDAVGGVVNIITKKPTGEPELSAAVTYGSLNTLKGWMTGSGGFDWGKFLLSVTHFQSKGDYDYETPEVWREGKKEIEATEGVRTNNDFFSDNVLAKADLSLTKNLTLTADNDFFCTERGQPGTIFDPRLEARQNVLRNLTTLKLERKGLFLDDLNAFCALFNRYDRTHFTDPNPGKGASGLNPIDTVSNSYAYGFQAGAELYRALRNTEHVVTWQGELKRDELRDEVQPWEEGYDDPFRTSYEWYLQDEVVLLGDRLSVIPAVRYEESTDFGDHWTGKIGVVGKPRPWLHVRSNFENSFRKPTFSELYFPDQGFIRGNPDLKAEKGVNLDAGLGLDFPRFFFQAAYFRNWIEESIIWLPVSFWTIAPVNTGPVDQWGVEAEAEFKPCTFLSLSSNYTFLDAVTQDTGEQQDGRPRHTVNFKATVSGDLGEIYCEMQHLSSIPVRFTETAKRSISPRTVVDTGLTVNILKVPLLKRVPGLKKCTLGFEVKNVADVTVYDAQFFPLPGRMFFVTLHSAL